MGFIESEFKNASNVFPSVVFSPLLLKISYENSIEDVGFFVHWTLTLKVSPKTKGFKNLKWRRFKGLNM